MCDRDVLGAHKRGHLRATVGLESPSPGTSSVMGDQAARELTLHVSTRS